MQTEPKAENASEKMIVDEMNEHVVMRQSMGKIPEPSPMLGVKLAREIDILENQITYLEGREIGKVNATAVGNLQKLMGIEACTQKIEYFDKMAPERVQIERDRLIQEKAALIQEKLEKEKRETALALEQLEKEKRETAVILEKEKRETAAIQEKEKRETALALEQLEKAKQETIKLQNATVEKRKREGDSSSDMNKKSSASYAEVYRKDYAERIKKCYEMDIFGRFAVNFTSEATTKLDEVGNSYVFPKNDDDETAVASKFQEIVQEIYQLQLATMKGSAVHYIDTHKSSQGLLKHRLNPDLMGSASKDHHQPKDAVWAGELKKPAMDERAAKAQTLDYAKSILSSQPWRNEVLVFLSNGINLYFYSYHRMNPEIYEWKVQIGKHGIKRLAFFLRGTAEEHGHSSIPSILIQKGTGNVEYNYTRSLGSGSSSSVFLYYCEQNTIAVKFYTFTEPTPLLQSVMHRENTILEILKEVAGVPKVVGRGDNYLAMTPVGDPLPDSLPDEMLRKFVKLLKQIHAKGVIHMDLRLPNLMLVGEQPLIVDFGFARTVEGAESKILGRATDKYIDSTETDAFIQDLIVLVRAFYFKLFDDITESPTVYTSLYDKAKLWYDEN